MRIQQGFEVGAPVDQVWTMFQDIRSVAQCLPGAEMTGDLGDGRYSGRMHVKLGPMGFGFEGEATIRPDAAARCGIIEGRGVDKKGGSRGSVRVRYDLTEVDALTKVDGRKIGGRTAVSLETDLTLAGPAAQFGRTGLIEEVSKRLLGQFVMCLEAKLGASTEEEAADIRAGDVGAASLLLGAMSDRLKRGLRG